MPRAFTLSLLLALGLGLMAEEPGALGLTAAAPMVRAVPGISLRCTAQVPAAVDLSAGFPAPMNQGRVGSCVACAIGYGIKSYQEAIDTPGLGLTSKTRLFSPSFLYNQYGNGRDWGANPMMIFDIIGRRGCATLKTMPYTTRLSRFPTAAQAKAALPFRAATTDAGDYPYYCSIPKYDLVAMKLKLSQGTPLAIGMRVDRAFDSLRAGTSFVWYPNNLAIRGWHEIAIIGYDDDRTDGNGHVGAFRIQNSWGRSWGDHGRGWVAYDALATGSVIDVGYGSDRRQYVPTIIGKLHIVHPRRGTLMVSVRIGDPAQPVWTYRYYSPTNTDARANLATELDLSDAAAYWPPSPARPWWVCVSDVISDESAGRVTLVTLTNAAVSSQVLVPAVALPQQVPDVGGIAIPITGALPVPAPGGNG